MKRLVLATLVLVLLLLAGGVLTLAVWEPQRPVQQIEKVIPNDRFSG